MTILVAVADDPVRERVLDVAVDFGRAFGEDLSILHLVEETSADADARRIRDEVRSYLGASDVASTVSVEYIGHSTGRSGPRTAQELLDAAAEVEVSHIVLGHSSKGLFESLARGSTSFAVVESAEVPVTIVPDGADT